MPVLHFGSFSAAELFDSPFSICLKEEHVVDVGGSDWEDCEEQVVGKLELVEECKPEEFVKTTPELL